MELKILAPIRFIQTSTKSSTSFKRFELRCFEVLLLNVFYLFDPRIWTEMHSSVTWWSNTKKFSSFEEYELHDREDLELQKENFKSWNIHFPWFKMILQKTHTWVGRLVWRIRISSPGFESEIPWIEYLCGEC